ncbi:SusC/RagA family TonB-linked outer membrane protein [Flavivirga abyssicola]|uniref:SusC/RagA family TonB-linked outer membrane protein n=1 Tax=Flavivirga abyssicola TaxID=3063533 RepID=UPI0026E04D71|nr:SusC/RagA family TonB-linked outer membrane protein [Flavivirga sp. MEBiC07777]WVK11663.1 SusC/RagA family TonB-linked outer membrane protein [Flavivirga sp. MEBiC07777]
MLTINDFTMIKTKILYIVLAGVFSMISLKVKAQEEEIDNLNKVSATITNKSGDQLSDVYIKASKSRNTTITDKSGFFSLSVQDEDILIISRLGYENKLVYITEGALENETIVLKQWGVIKPEEAINISLGSLPFERITGSVERITGEELNDFPTAFTQEALAGRLSGLKSTYDNASPVSESFRNSIRNQEDIQIYVDGIPSSLVLTPAEVDDVVIAKDYGSSFMYGTLGASGAMLVNTKKGLPGGRSFRFRSRTGVRTSAFLPNTMNAQEYARNYNIALSNDGFSPIYTQNDISDYTTGANPVRNPNNNYYEDLIGGFSTYKHITGDFSGGNEGVQYFSHLGVYSTDGIEKVGDGRKLSRFRLNNNVRIKLGDAGIVNVGIGGSFNTTKEPRLNANEAFATMYSYPANALPYKINDSIYAITPEYGTNLLTDLAHGPIIEDTRRDAFARIGLDLNLDELIKGLTFKGLIGTYTLNVLSKQLQTRTANGNTELLYLVDRAEPVFTLNNDGTYTTTFRKFKAREPDNIWERYRDQVDRSQFINVNLHYNRDFNKNHKVIADLIFTNQKVTGSGLDQNLIFRNLGLRVNYLINQKYVLEGKLMNTPIRQLSKDERKTINYDAGIAWLLHKENFLNGSSWLNFLKLRANFGVQSRPVTQFFISENLYVDGPGATFGIVGASGGVGGQVRAFTAPDELLTPKQEYLSAGLDFQMFKSKINGQINYFNIRNYDQIIAPENLYALIPGQYVPLDNYGDSKFRGIDASISYNGKIGENLSFRIGVNAMYGDNHITASDNVNYPEQYRNINGNSESRILGLKAEGIFQNEAEIANAVPQLFGEVKPGDIKYKDFNNDGVVDEKDIHEIGNAPRMSYGINYMMQYKSWSLSIHGDGVLGGSYIEELHWNTGTNDYTTTLAKSWPVSNSLPRLTTLNNENNYRNSSFWLENADYFNLRSIMIAYTLPKALLNNLGVKEFTFSGSVKNPFVISYSKDRFMPSKEHGYTLHPVLKAFELGIQVSF